MLERSKAVWDREKHFLEEKQRDLNNTIVTVSLFLKM